MNTLSSFRVKTLRVLVCLTMIASTACGGDDDPATDNNTTKPDECPGERPVKCADDSCVESRDQCDDEEEEEEEEVEIDGEVTSLNPTTVHADSPEAVVARLSVSDTDEVERLVAEGANWQVEIETPDGPQVADASAERDGDSDTYVVTFMPSGLKGPGMVNVSVQLAAGDDEGQLYAWGSRGKLALDGFQTNSLRIRADASTLEFEGRESFQLEGVHAADRVWTGDLDGDGREDLVVSHTDGTSQMLSVFKCGDDLDSCEPAGDVTLASSEAVLPDMIVAPDMAAGGSDSDASGMLFATVAARDADGTMTEVEVLHLTMTIDDTTPVLNVDQETIELGPSSIEGRLHEQTLKPRLILNAENGESRPALMVTTSIQTADTTQWLTSLVDVNGLFQNFRGPGEIEGLDGNGRAAALGGHLSICMPGDKLQETGITAPDGMIVSSFEYDGKSMLAVGQIDSTQPMQVFTLSEQLDHGAVGANASARCELHDFDGDGREDLVVSISGSDVYSKIHENPLHSDEVSRPDLLRGVWADSSLFVAMGIEDSDLKRRVSTPALLVEDINAHDWSARGLVGFGSFSISKRSARTGRSATGGGGGRISLRALESHQIDLEFELIDGSVHVTPVNDPPVVSGPTFHCGGEDSVCSLMRGSDRVLRKRPGRTSDGTIRADRPIVESTQILDEDGSWMVIHYGGKLTANTEEGPLLVSTDPETIAGWLSSTGPFNPVELPEASAGGKAELIEAMASHAGLSRQDKTSPALYHMRVNEEGSLQGLDITELTLEEELSVITHDFDLSDVEVEGKNVVKFKAGAELSKAVNIAAPDDEDCDDDGVCPSPADVIAIELDTGEVLTGIIPIPSEEAGDTPAIKLESSDLRSALLEALGVDPSADLSSLETDLRIMHSETGEVVVALFGTLESEGEITEAYAGLRRKAQAGRPGSQSLKKSFFGDVYGHGGAQKVKCGLSDSKVVCSTEHLSAEPADDSDLGVTTVETEVSMEGALKAVIDVDGDGCADLVTDRGELFSSRCDGSFEPEAIELGSWSAHLDRCGDSSSQRAQDYNSSRSNKPSTVWWSDPDDDGDGLPIEALPFFDAFEMPIW